MTASEISAIVSKAFNREIICINDPEQGYVFFLSEKDKENWLANRLIAPDTFKPAAFLLPVEVGNKCWETGYIDFEGTLYKSTVYADGTNTLKEVLYLLMLQLFSSRFLASYFRELKG